MPAALARGPEQSLEFIRGPKHFVEFFFGNDIEVIQLLLNCAGKNWAQILVSGWQCD